MQDVFALPGLAGGVGPQLFDRHQHGAAVPLGQRRAFTEEFWESLGLTQVHLDMQNMSLQAQKTPTSRQNFPSHLPELALAKLLPEDEALPRELCGRDVLPGEGVHGEGGDGVHVAAGDALQPHDVRLGVVRRAAVEALVRRALGDIGLGVAAAAR